MSTALYRRYRSARFGDLVGQDVIAQTLRNEVQAGSLAHAYLFTGIRGTGKTSTARILARAVNCAQPAAGEPCNQCPACLEVLDGSSVDVLEIDAASNRGIDEMRDLREKVKYLPATLRRKVYIIDEAHMLTSEAWNAFLKTLEEPPPHVLFVLATTEPHKIPETVRSRVQRFDFRRVSVADTTAHLNRILESESVEAEPAAVELLARAGQGSMRDSLSMLDQALAGGERPLTATIVRRALGLADPLTLRGLLEAIAGRDGAGALRAVAVAFDAGADPRQILREAARMARAAEFASLGHDAVSDMQPDEAGFAATLARITPPGFWLHALEVLQATELELRQPVDARLQVEYCVMRLLRDGSPDDPRVAALEDRVAKLEGHGTERGVAPAAVAAPVAAPPQREQPAASLAVTKPFGAPADDASVDGGATEAANPAAPAGEEAAFDSVAAWQDSWSIFVEAVSRQDRALAGVLRDCRAVEADATSLTIGAPYRFHREKLQEPARHAVLVAAAGEVAGSARAVDTSYTGEESGPARRPTGTGEMTQAVLDTFAGSRVTSTRLREHADRPSHGPA